MGQSQTRERFQNQEWASGSNYYASNTAQLEPLFQVQRAQNPAGYAYNQRFQSYYLQMPLNIPKPDALVTMQPYSPQ